MSKVSARLPKQDLKIGTHPASPHVPSEPKHPEAGHHSPPASPHVPTEPKHPAAGNGAHPAPSHPEPSHPAPSHPEPSHPAPSHPEPSHPAPSHPHPPTKPKHPEDGHHKSPVELTQLRNLHVGDLILADITVDHKVEHGKLRLCVVLVPGDAQVEVAYLTTFGHSTSLPATVDKKLWYPFKPAHKEGTLEPLPELGIFGVPRWASLQAMHKVTMNPVGKLKDLRVPENSAEKIKEHIKA